PWEILCDVPSPLVPLWRASPPNVDLMFDTVGSIMSQARERNVRALGVTGASRSSIAPEFPPIADTLPGFSVAAFYGIGVRAGTPKDICDVIERHTSDLPPAEFPDRLRTFAAEARPLNGGASHELARERTGKMGQVDLRIKTANRIVRACLLRAAAFREASPRFASLAITRRGRKRRERRTIPRRHGVENARGSA